MIFNKRYHNGPTIMSSSNTNPVNLYIIHSCIYTDIMKQSALIYQKQHLKELKVLNSYRT